MLYALGVARRANFILYKLLAESVTRKVSNASGESCTLDRLSAAITGEAGLRRRRRRRSEGEFHDQADAKWIMIRGSKWSLTDTPCGRPNPGRPIGARG
jgi:hypothetical protein